MKSKEIRSMSEAEIKIKLEDLRKELVKDNSAIATGTIPKSPGKMRNNKKTIARILTLKREKELNKKDDVKVPKEGGKKE